MVLHLKKPEAVITDIEGTTTSNRFWSEILQPFIHKNIEACIRDTWNQLETIDVITILRNKAIEDYVNGDVDVPQIAPESAPQKEIISSVVRNVQFLLNSKRQSYELKSATLLVWLYGCKNDLIRGHVYPDVMSSFKRWKNELGIKIYTFATGDRIIQKMLFAYSSSGNLTTYIDDYFNYELIGKKTDIESYRLIAKRILKTLDNNSIIFLSDNITELKASQIAGLTPILVIRSHNSKSIDNSPFKYITSFDDLEFS